MAYETNDSDDRPFTQAANCALLFEAGHEAQAERWINSCTDLSEVWDEGATYARFPDDSVVRWEGCEMREATPEERLKADL